jgi:hypothetical protein
MTEQRHTASTITDIDLDRLYRRIETLEHVARSNLRHVQLIVPELEKAETAIERVRALASRWAVMRAYGSAATELRAALEESKE